MCEIANRHVKSSIAVFSQFLGKRENFKEIIAERNRSAGRRVHKMTEFTFIRVIAHYTVEFIDAVEKSRGCIIGKFLTFMVYDEPIDHSHVRFSIMERARWAWRTNW